MVDELCTRKSFLVNQRIQRLVTHVFQWMVTFLYGLQQMFMFAGERTRALRMNTKYRGIPKMNTKENNLEHEEGTNLMKISH